MTCREFASFMLEYLTGELSPDTVANFEWHLSRCRNCTEYLAQYRATIVAGKAAYQDLDESVPEEVPDDLVRAILASWRQ